MEDDYGGYYGAGQAENTNPQDTAENGGHGEGNGDTKWDGTLDPWGQGAATQEQNEDFYRRHEATCFGWWGHPDVSGNLLTASCFPCSSGIVTRKFKAREEGQQPSFFIMQPGLRITRNYKSFVQYPMKPNSAFKVKIIRRGWGMCVRVGLAPMEEEAPDGKALDLQTKYKHLVGGVAGSVGYDLRSGSLWAASENQADYGPALTEEDVLTCGLGSRGEVVFGKNGYFLPDASHSNFRHLGRLTEETGPMQFAIGEWAIWVFDGNTFSVRVIDHVEKDRQYKVHGLLPVEGSWFQKAFQERFVPESNLHKVRVYPTISIHSWGTVIEIEPGASILDLTEMIEEGSRLCRFREQAGEMVCDLRNLPQMEESGEGRLEVWARSHFPSSNLYIHHEGLEENTLILISAEQSFDAGKNFSVFRAAGLPVLKARIGIGPGRQALVKSNDISWLPQEVDLCPELKFTFVATGDAGNWTQLNAKRFWSEVYKVHGQEDVFATRWLEIEQPPGLTPETFLAPMADVIYENDEIPFVYGYLCLLSGNRDALKKLVKFGLQRGFRGLAPDADFLTYALKLWTPSQNTWLDAQDCMKMEHLAAEASHEIQGWLLSLWMERIANPTDTSEVLEVAGGGDRGNHIASFPLDPAVLFGFVEECWTQVSPYGSDLRWIVLGDVWQLVLWNQSEQAALDLMKERSTFTSELSQVAWNSAVSGLPKGLSFDEPRVLELLAKFEPLPGTFGQQQSLLWIKLIDWVFNERPGGVGGALRTLLSQARHALDWRWFMGVGGSTAPLDLELQDATELLQLLKCEEVWLMKDGHRVTQAAMRRLASLPPVKKMASEVKGSRPEVEEALGAMFLNHFRDLVPSTVVADAKLKKWGLASKDHNHAYEGQIVQSLLNDRVEKQAYYWIDDEWWSRWDLYTKSGIDMVPMKLGHSKSCSGELFWTIFFERFGTEGGIACSRRNRGTYSFEQNLVLDDEQLMAIHALGKSSLAELYDFCEYEPELSEVVPYELKQVVSVTTKWIHQRLANNRATGAEIQHIREEHLYRSKNTAKDFVSQVCSGSGLLEAAWTAWGELADFLRRAHSVSRAYPCVVDVTSDAQKEAERWEALLFTSEQSSWSEWERELPAKDVVERLRTLLGFAVFKAFCSREDRISKHTQTGLDWAAAPGILTVWDEVRHARRETAAEIQNLFDLLNIDQLWEERDKAVLTTELRESVGEDVTQTVLFTISLKRSRGFVGAILDVLKMLETVYPGVNVAQGELVDDLTQLLGLSEENPTPEIRNKVARLEEQHLVKWSDSRCTYANAIAKGLDKIRKAHSAMTSEHFDELQRVVNGLPGMVEEQQVFQTLADLMNSLKPLSDPAEYFAEGTKAVLDWLAVPNDDEMSRLQVTIEALDDHLEVFHSVAKEWSTNEYDKNLEQAEAALSAVQVELRLTGLSSAEMQAIRADAVEQHMYFKTESKTSYCFGDWTKFDQLKLVECRMLLYGQTEEQEQDQNRKLMNDFRRLASNVERLACLQLMMMQQGFLDIQLCTSIYKKDADSDRNERLDALVAQTAALQSELDSETGHITREGGTFLPTAMLARVLRELSKNPPQTTGQVPKALNGLGKVFDLQSVKIPSEGSIAKQIVELDKEMRNAMIQDDAVREISLDFVLPLDIPEESCSLVLRHDMIPELFLVTAVFAKARKRLPRFYELLLYCPESQVPLEELVAFLARLQSPKQDEFFLVAGWNHAPKEHQALLREKLPSYTTVVFLSSEQIQAPTVDCVVLKNLVEVNEAQAFLQNVGAKGKKGNSMLEKLRRKLVCATCYTSQFPGAGKSHRIRKEQPNAARLSLFHNYTTAGLQESLQSQYDNKTPAIWFNLSQRCPQQAEFDLYRLLVCGMLNEPNAFPLALDTSVQILLELPMKCDFNFLREGIDVVEIRAPSEQSAWGAGSGLFSDWSVQVTCKFLKEVETREYKERGCWGDLHEVSDDECVRLLREHGPKYNDKPAVDTSTVVLIQFCRYVASQLTKLNNKDVPMPDFDKEAQKYSWLMSEAVKKLVRNAAQMYEVSIDHDTFELSRSWGSDSIEPLLFLNRGPEPYITVFGAPNQPDPSHFDWARIGATVNRVDGGAAWAMLDRVMALPKLEISIKDFEMVSLSNAVDARNMAQSMDDSGELLEDVVVAGTTFEAGCTVQTRYLARLKEASEMAITADTSGMFPMMLIINLAHIKKVLENIDESFQAKKDFVLNGTHVRQGQVLRREVYFPNSPDKYPVLLESVTEIQTGGLEFPLGLTVLEPEAAIAENGYVLTMDNVLKMILIRFRLDHGPVMIMGETGCGKTSLIKYLCGVAGIALHVLDVHGGIEVQHVREFMAPVITEANHYLEVAQANYHSDQEPRQVWIFLDELNTSACVDFFAEMICDARFDGEPLPKNVRVLGASNPYRKSVKGVQSNMGDKLGRQCSSLQRTYSSQGLQRSRSQRGLAETEVKQDDLTLVYQVLPLPEKLRDFVWDFGALADLQRNKYVREMVKTHFRAPECMGGFAQLIVSAMKLLLRTEDVSCVSLRDARRAVRLACFYHEDQGIQAAHAAVLAAAVCFFYRLGTDGERREFLKRASEQVDKNGNHLRLPFETARELLDSYQEKFTNIVDIPRGVARNESLTSNLFVMFTAVSVKPPLPVFVVGKPGQSKTLAVSLLGSGRTAKPEYQVPLLSVLSYQCSEHTTASGLDKHFEQGEILQDKRKGSRTPVCMVIFLDEVGLAEKNTRDRPLKVLHKRLEHPNVGFVGLSNTPLDASKMNRAIYLTHLDPGVDDLRMTAQAILQGQAQTLDDASAEQLARTISTLFMGYLDRVQQLEDGRYSHLADFRGFYGLVKAMSRYIYHEKPPMSLMYSSSDICDLVVRNLGGAPIRDLDELLLDPMCEPDLGLAEAVREWRQITDYKQSAKRMMSQCLGDTDAQHLMVVAPDELYALRFLLYGDQPVLQRSDTKVFFGSSFQEERQSTLYILELLSKIRLAMEMGEKVVLLNLGRLHESLYEVLNQQYTYFNGKPTCRVALGSESRQVPVHKDFRCVVVLTAGEVHPPAKKLDEQESIQRRFLSALLSRFEKVVISYEVEIPQKLHSTCDELRTWITRLRPLNQIRPGQTAFKYHTFIPGTADDLVGMLMVKQLHTSKVESGEVLGASEASGAVKRAIKDMLPPLTVLKAPQLMADIVPYMKSAWRTSLFAALELGPRLVVRTFDRMSNQFDREAQAVNVKVQIVDLGEFTSRASFKMALEKAVRGGCLIIKCVETDTPPAMLHDCYEIMQSSFTGSDQGFLDEWQNVMFLLQQKPFTIGPRVTADFGSEWRQCWVDKIVEDSLEEVPLRLADLSQTPAQIVKGPKALEFFVAALRSFVVEAYVSYPIAAGKKMDAVKAMLANQELVKLASQRVLGLLSQTTDFRNWAKLLDKEYPQGVQQPLAQAAWSALVSRIHSGFADFWAELDAENNVDAFILQDDPFLRELWMCSARNSKLCPFRIRQTAIQRPCVAVEKHSVFPFVPHVQRWLGKIRSELVAYLAAQPDVKANERFASAVHWIQEQAGQLFSEAPVVPAPPSDEKKVRTILLESLAKAVARSGLEELLLPVARSCIEPGMSKDPWKFIASIVAAVFAAEQLFLSDSASFGCLLVLKRILTRTGEWPKLAAGCFSPEDMIDKLLTLGSQGLKSSAMEGEAIIHVDLAHLETALRAFTNVPRVSLAKLASEHPTASLIVRAKACADLALSIGDKQRAVLADFAALILSPTSASGFEEALLENLQQLPGFLQAHEKFRSALMTLVGRSLRDAKTSLADVIHGDSDKCAVLMLLMDSDSFPPKVALELIQEAMNPAILEAIEQQLRKRKITDLPWSPLAQAVFLMLEAGVELPPIDQGKFYLEYMGKIAGIKNMFAEVRKQVIECEQHNRYERTPDDVQDSWSRAPAPKKWSETKVKTAQQVVESFYKATNQVGEGKDIRTWALDQLDDEFTEEVVRTQLFLDDENMEYRRHLLEPHLISKEELDESQDMDFLKYVPTLAEGGRYLQLKHLARYKEEGYIAKMLKILADSEHPAFILCVAVHAAGQKVSLPLDLPKHFEQDGAALTSGEFPGLDAKEMQLFKSIVKSSGSSFLGTKARASMERGESMVVAEDVERLIVMSLAAALDISKTNPSHPARVFMQQPHNFKDKYLWGLSKIKFYDQVFEIQLSEYSQRLNREITYLPIYECSNGHPYWLGNCSRPWKVYTCQFCPSRIGGTNHRLIEGNRNVPRPEWTQPQKGYAYSRHAYKTDELQPKAFAALHFFTHALLVGALSVFPEGQDSATRYLPDHFPARRPLVEDVMAICVDVLSHLMEAPGERKRRSGHVMDLALMFGDLMSFKEVWSASGESIQAFNQAPGALMFDKTFNIFADTPREPASGSTSKAGMNPYEHKVFHGTRIFLDMPSSKTVKEASYLDYRATLEQKQGECPTCLNLLSSWSKLVYVTYLPDLLAILRALYSSYNGGRLSKAEALNMPLKQALGEKRCMEMWLKFRTAWNNMRHNLDRIECADVTLMEMGEEPPPTIGWFVCLDRGEGMQLWSLIEQVAGYQNTFIKELPRHLQVSEKVDVLQFEQRFAVGGGDVSDDSEFGWMESALPCALHLSSGHVTYEVEPFEAAAKVAVAPLRYIDLKKPVFQFADVQVGWQETLEEKIPQVPLPLGARTELNRRTKSGEVNQDAISALLLLVTKCVHQLLRGVRADAQMRLCDFAEHERLAQYGATFPGELAEVRLEHLAGFWALLFEYYEPDFKDLTDLAYREEWSEHSSEDDQAICDLWRDLKKWPLTELRKLYVGFKIMLIDHLFELDAPPESPMGYTLAPITFPEADGYYLPYPFPVELQLRHSLAAFEYVGLALNPDAGKPEAMLRMEERERQKEAERLAREEEEKARSEEEAAAARAREEAAAARWGCMRPMRDGCCWVLRWRSRRREQAKQSATAEAAAQEQATYDYQMQVYGYG